MAKPEERRVPDERGARAEAAGRAKRGDSAGAATGDAAHGDSDGQDPAVSTCAEADEREVEGATFFANTACRWFPCHETADPEHFNCLFCFCPVSYTHLDVYKRQLRQNSCSATRSRPSAG